MTRRSLCKYLVLDAHSEIPKYQQLARKVQEAIAAKRIKRGQMLPSINELKSELKICKATAERGYKCLTDEGMIKGVPGKGYFVSSADVKWRLKVLLLFNNLNSSKRTIYDSISEVLSKHATIDLNVFNNDLRAFNDIIRQKNGNYTHYLIVPHFDQGAEKAHKILNTIEKGRLILLDRLVPKLSADFSAVYGNFQGSIFCSLEKVLPRLLRYHTINIVFPKSSYFAKEIAQSFREFCCQYKFNGRVLSDFANHNIEQGEVFITFRDIDLTTIIEKIQTKNYAAGQEVGVISYNETPSKQIILNDITTISTDFQKMGKMAAELVLCDKTKRIELLCDLALKSSL